MANSAHCPLEDCARVYPTYDPSLGGNVTFLVLFAVLIPAALAMGFRYHNMVFSTALATGFALEVMGYIGQVLLSNGRSNRASYIVFLLGTILGPNFIFGAMFLVMPHVVRLYGQEFKGWRPSWYRAMFYGLSILSLALELAGSFVATGSSYDTVDTGTRVLAAGLAVYLIGLIVFAGHACLFAIAVQTRHHILDVTFAAVYNSGLFRAFLFGFSAATFLLVLRTAFRVVVIAEGFQSTAARTEAFFLVFDGAAVFLASAALVTFFPGRVFGRSWREVAAPPSSSSSAHVAHHTHYDSSLPKSAGRPLRPSRPQPVQLLPASASKKSPGLDRLSPRSIGSYPGNSPRKAQAPAPPPQRNMVNSEDIW